MHFWLGQPPLWCLGGKRKGPFDTKSPLESRITIKPALLKQALATYSLENGTSLRVYLRSYIICMCGHNVHSWIVFECKHGNVNEQGRCSAFTSISFRKKREATQDHYRERGCLLRRHQREMMITTPFLLRRFSTSSTWCPPLSPLRSRLLLLVYMLLPAASILRLLRGIEVEEELYFCNFP